jgi:hypothetical protein
MELPQLTDLPKLKSYAIGAGAFLLILGAVYLAGHRDGWNEADNKWKADISNADYQTVRIDTISVVQQPQGGTFSSSPLSDDGAKTKVDEAVERIKTLVGVYATENDSLRQINRQLTTSLQLALEPKLIKLSTPELGDLILKYFPADSSANVYRHLPPPVKTVTVYQEKVVIQPQSTWMTVGHYAVGIAVGVVAGYVISHK